MDLPGEPSPPTVILERCKSEVDSFEEELKKLPKSSSVKSQVHVQARSYGCSVRISWIRISDCMCCSQLCAHNECIREVLIKVRDDFGVESFHHSLQAELTFYNGFCK